MSNLSEKFAGTDGRIDQSNATLDAILAAIQAQNPLPSLAAILAALEAINTGIGLLLASLTRVEQFIAPVGQTIPTGNQAGMAHDLRRLALLMTGPSSTGVGTSYGRDVFTVLLQDGLDAWTAGAAAAARIQAAVWPTGQDQPEFGANNSLYWYLRHLLAATSAPTNDPTPRQPLQVALMNLLSTSTDISADTAWLVGAIGGRVENKSAIDWLAEIAECSCGGQLPPPSPGGCVAPEVSVGAVSTGARLYASWGGSGQIFFVGAVEFESQPGEYPLGVGLVSNVWTELSIYVASSAPYWSATDDEIGEVYPVNTWLTVPRGAGETLAVNVAAGHTLTAYLCAADAQPEPEPGWTVLTSTGGTILNAQGVPDPELSYGYAINDWHRIGLSSRQTNSQSGYTHVMEPGSYVDLDQTYTVYSDREFNVYRGSEGFVATVAANQQYEIGPGTNYSVAKAGANFSLYIRPGPISP